MLGQNTNPAPEMKIVSFGDFKLSETFGFSGREYPPPKWKNWQIGPEYPSPIISWDLVCKD